MVLIPLGLTYLWTHHADQIKLANPSTAWLTSKNLSNWNYGTLSQKFNLKNWWVFIKNTQEYFFFGGSAIFLVVSLILAIKAPKKVREIVISCILGTFLTIFIFFNLYNQQQYYVALTAFMSILVGYGLSWVIQYLQKQNSIWLSFIFIILFGFAVEYPGIVNFKDYREIVDYYHANSTVNYNALAQTAKKITPTDGYVISIQNDWAPELALALDRKVFILNGRNSPIFDCNVINQTNYTTVIGPADAPLTQQALSCFASNEQVGPGVFSVTHSH
jgi:hypothetical protein